MVPDTQLPDKEHTIPEENHTIPEENHPVPATNHPVPEEGCDVPEKKQPVPEEKQPVPEEKQPVPEEPEEPEEIIYSDEVLFTYQNTKGEDIVEIANFTIRTLQNSQLTYSTVSVSGDDSRSGDDGTPLFLIPLHPEFIKKKPFENKKIIYWKCFALFGLSSGNLLKNILNTSIKVDPSETTFLLNTLKNALNPNADIPLDKYLKDLKQTPRGPFALL